MKPQRNIALTLILALSLVACSSDGEQRSDAGDGAPGSATTPPRISPDAGPFVFTWIDEDGEFNIAQQINEIPENRRAFVRVQDPSRPPSESDQVWIADLSELQGGQYPVRSLARAEFESRGGSRPESLTPPPTKNTPTTATPAQASEQRVVMYMTSTCPVCHRARRWLTQNNISFVERNIERDAEAARELREKASRQGVSARGVPVFDINGRLIAGFDQAALSRALGR